MVRTGLVLVATVTALLGGTSDARATGGAARLRALLATAQVPLERGAKPAAASFPAAWAAFQRFSTQGEPNAVLRYGFGVYESRLYGTSFELELTGGDVHLVVHFPVAAYLAITRTLDATPCIPGAGCTFRCFFANDDSLVPRPCRVGPSGYRVASMTLSATQTRRTRWIDGVESSPVFRALLAHHVRPDGYEVWQGSAG